MENNISNTATATNNDGDVSENIKLTSKSICEHGRKYYFCKDCKGPGICVHDKYKHYCSECGGASLCRHNRNKSRCKECGGSNICIHKKRKDECKACKGSGVCDHGKIRARCRLCHGSAFCEHSKLRSICRDCKGSALCCHNRQKSYCHDCNGSAFCIHKRHRNRCIECKGDSVCPHDKYIYRCKICDGSHLCKSAWCETYKNPNIEKYEGYCVACFVNNPENIHKESVSNFKSKEKNVVSHIMLAFPEFTWVHDKRVKDGCSFRRPDLLLDMGSHIIIIEIDENRHTTYDFSCENKRLMELSRDLQHRPIVFLRFNPDGYKDESGKSISSCWKLNKLGIMSIISNKTEEWLARIAHLTSQIQHWIDNPSEKTIEIVELFY